MKTIKTILAHLTVSLSLALTVILVIDMFFNSAMGFVNSAEFKWLCLVFCVLSAACAVAFIADMESEK